jgi:diguanylate cyclase (GGDEF)-like protein
VGVQLVGQHRLGCDDVGLTTRRSPTQDDGRSGSIPPTAHGDRALPMPRLPSPEAASAAVRPNRSLRIWAVIVTVVLFGAALLASGATSQHPPGSLPVTWWMLACGFALTEAVVLHVQIRREARSVSLSEIPLCIALFFAAPWALIAGRLVGSIAVWIFWRRQPVIKMAFNVANATAEIALALVVFHAVARGTGPRGWPVWAAMELAAVASSTFAALAVTAVIAAAERGLPGRQLLAVLLAAPLAAMVSVVGLLNVAALSWSGWMVLPLAVSAVGIMVVYRAYASLAGRHLSLERLYRFSQVVGSSPEVDEVLRTVLLQAQELLRAEQAEITFINPVAHPGGLSIRLGADGRLIRFPAGEELYADPVWRAVLSDGVPVLIQRHDRDASLQAHLRQRSLVEAIIAPMHGDAGVVGAVTVANRMGDVRTFDTADVRLLETVANTAGVAWQNSRLIDRLRHDSLHDALTELPNRVLLQQRTTEALARMDEGSMPGVAMLLVDLDGFKEVNDTLGHQYGDLLLREVAQRFTRAAGERGLVARLGGDEFAVLVPDTRLENTTAVVSDLLQSLQAPIVLDDLALEISASIGVAAAPNHARQTSGLLKRADVAMYAAKSSASGMQVYHPDMDTGSPQRLALARELRQAIDEHQMRIFVQPQASLATGAVASVEALARWHHPEKGWIRPEEFVAVAERSGLIRNLTADVLLQAVAAAAAWRRSGREIGVSVNLSARNLQDPNLPDLVAAVLDEHDLPAELLTFEITESIMMTDSDRSQRLLERLSALGVQLSIDDFGTGYSSLSNLRRLPLKEVKIDRSFVQNMSRDANDASIAKAIIDLGANLDLRVVAEGVEQDETWRYLADLGCELAQGFLVSRPMAAGAFLPWLDRYEQAGV